MLTASLMSSSSPTAQELEALLAVLAHTDPSRVMTYSQAGKLASIIPAWDRLTQTDWNTQHQTHHYPLDVHTFEVISQTKASPHFSPLTAYQKEITLLSALLHDIDKNTGPAWLRPKIPVDKLHPIKSAEMSREILAPLGVSWEALQRIYTLIHHHQAIGRLFIFFPEGAPHAVLQKIALKLRSVPLLHCLLALSQGDISGVKENNALFTENVATRIVAYAESIGQEIYHARHRIALLPQNWTLEDTGQDQPKLTNFQGFFFEADSEAALQQKLTQYALGGTCLLQYARSKEELAYMWKAPYAMVCRVLPENMSYAGPLPTPNLKETLSLATMPLFYALWLGEVHPTIPLSQAETHAFETLRDTQNHYQDTLIKHPAYSQATWHAMEEALFDPHVFFSAASSPASWLHGPYSQAQQATCDALCQKAPCYTLATRPHPIGLLSKTQEKAFGLAPDTLCLML